ncbi:BMP family ABC transporter substrate-binding protein [Paenibacillus alkaliterrae]|nr:BMP family ABC transporter substrate-binding protein [Paenibacillus alkaliterrae]MCF2940797.1 BMP family ABC transporter substrate-binding protein [Paenibacillus alkaliterrae]
MVTTNAKLEGSNPDKVIGFIGGMNDEVINDFKSGYEQGAAFIDPEVKVVAHYVGDFTNVSKAGELAFNQFREHKVDIIYNVAGGAGLGWGF